MYQPNSKIGDYTLKSKIGKGAFGVVWLAEREGIISTEFALKLPNEFDVDLDVIKQEATLWKKASGHPNVLPIIEANIYGEQAVIVSEYVPDGSLQDRLDKLKENDEKIPVEEVIELLIGILGGLEHLHNRNIIHQDLKPANILLQGETPRLADFGISGILSSKSYVKGTSGTLPYMSPETFVGKRSVQTDIWSTGVILYQLLSGNLPFPQQDIPSIMHAIINGEPSALPKSIPPSLQYIVEKALQKDPLQRYKSASEMRKAMREVQLPIPTKTLPSPPLPLPVPIPFPPNPIPPVPEPEKPKSKVWLWSVAGLLSLMLIALGFAFLYSRNWIITNERPIEVKGNSSESVTNKTANSITEKNENSEANQRSTLTYAANTATATPSVTPIPKTTITPKQTPCSTVRPPSSGDWFVILGTKPKIEEANQDLQYALSLGCNARIIDTDNYPRLSGGFYSVVIGPYSKPDAKRLRKQLEPYIKGVYIK